jgi:hypothetical protein
VAFKRVVVGKRGALHLRAFLTATLNRIRLNELLNRRKRHGTRSWGCPHESRKGPLFCKHPVLLAAAAALLPRIADRVLDAQGEVLRVLVGRIGAPMPRRFNHGLHGAVYSHRRNRPVGFWFYRGQVLDSAAGFLLISNRFSGGAGICA